MMGVPALLNPVSDPNIVSGRPASLRGRRPAAFCAAAAGEGLDIWKKGTMISFIIIMILIIKAVLWRVFIIC